MFHPLLEDVSKLKDQDLDAKIIELGQKYSIAARLGQSGVANQIIMILDSLRSEQHRRQLELSKSVMNKQNKGLDDLINVN
jgi:hypothetical protein